MAFVLVVGDSASLRSEDGAATQLARLGAEVRARDLFGPFEGVSSDDARCRAIVIEAGDRPDLAATSIRMLRKEEALAETPILMAIPERQVARLDPATGFDDFIVAPYFAAELYTRVRTLEWRKSEFAGEELVKIGDVVVDVAAHDVRVGGRPVALTAREFALLVFLINGRGRVLSRDTILARVWGTRYEGGARTVDIHVRRLRAKLGDAFPLETLRGAGYKLRTPDQSIEEDEEGEEGERVAAEGTPPPSVPTHDLRPGAEPISLARARSRMSLRHAK